MIARKSDRNWCRQLRKVTELSAGPQLQHETMAFENGTGSLKSMSPIGKVR
jgi:hypothetical protein